MVTRRDLLTRGLLGAAGLSLAGCAPATPTRPEPSGSPTMATRPQPSGSPTPTTGSSKTLVAVFSRAGENHYYGGRTWLEVGNTEVVVGLLATLVDVDVYRIVPAEPYPTDYEETVAQNSREQDADVRPRVADPLPDLAGYDRVALLHLGKRINWLFITICSFTTYALSHNIGASVVSGGVVRYRAYSTNGLSPAEIGFLIAFCSFTFALGTVTLIGIVLVLDPDIVLRFGDVLPISIFSLPGKHAVNKEVFSVT